MTKLITRHASASCSTSTGRPRRISWRRTGSNSSSMADLDPMGVMLPNRSAAAETRLPRDEGDEATGDGANDGRPFRGSHDDLEPLSARAAGGDDEPAARLELATE